MKRKRNKRRNCEELKDIKIKSIENLVWRKCSRGQLEKTSLLIKVMVSEHTNVTDCEGEMLRTGEGRR